MSLDESIRESPCDLVGDVFWMYTSEGLPADASGIWNLSSDGLEVTKLVASRTRPPDFTSGYGPLRAFRLRVSKPFAAPGFLAAACSAIAGVNVPVLVISTYTYDYVLVRSESVDAAAGALRNRGFQLAV